MGVKLVQGEMMIPCASGVRRRPPNERAYAPEGGRPRIGTGVASILAALSFLATLALHAPVTGAATYKWIDEKGSVHYSDSLPPEAMDRGNVQLNKQGVPINKTDPAPTAEQRKAMQDEADRQKALAKEREISDRRDRALMDSYTSEDEIDLAKTRAVATIDNQLQSAQAYSTSLSKRREVLLANKAASGDKGMAPALERELEGIDSELAKQDGLVVQKKKELEVVTAKYDVDKQRWRELRARQEANAAAAAAAKAASPTGTPSPGSQKPARLPAGSPPPVAGGSK